MTELEQLLAMLRRAQTVYYEVRERPHGGTIVELDSGRHGYSFIFQPDGSLLTTEPSGY
jgi:hypothetical protein